MDYVNIIYENEWERTAVHVDVETSYKEDYQMKMLIHNQIPFLLKVAGKGRDGKSRYTFYPGNSISMEKLYGRKEMKKEDVEQFTEQFMEMIDEVRGHLLDPDNVLLVPELVFVENGTYRFCYLPVRDPDKERNLCTLFHEMTEYFVRRLDYQDTDGVLLVYRLHKETLRESYDLKKIMEEYRKEKESQRESDKRQERRGLPDAAVFYTNEDDTEEDAENPAGKRTEILREPRSRYGILEKTVRKIKSGRWGRWEELITEIDGQEAEGPL